MTRAETAYSLWASVLAALFIGCGGITDDNAPDFNDAAGGTLAPITPTPSAGGSLGSNGSATGGRSGTYPGGAAGVSGSGGTYPDGAAGVSGSGGTGGVSCSGQLFGFYDNAPGDGPENMQTVVIDLKTGDKRILVTHPLSVPEVDTAATYDARAGRIYTHHNDSVSTFDASTGALISTTFLARSGLPGDGLLIELEMDRMGRLLGFMGGDRAYMFVEVDPVTGAVKVLNDRALESGLISRTSAADPFRNLLHYASGGGVGPGIVSIDTLTGNVVSSMPTDDEVVCLKADGRGRVVGFMFKASGLWQFSMFDPMTRTTTPIATDLSGTLWSGLCAIDVDAGVFLQETGNTVSDQHGVRSDYTIWAVDIATGSVAPLVKLDRQLRGIELVRGCRQ